MPRPAASCPTTRQRCPVGPGRDSHSAEPGRRGTLGGPVQRGAQLPGPPPERPARQHPRLMIGDHDHLLAVRQINARDRVAQRHCLPQPGQARVAVAITPGNTTTVRHGRPPSCAWDPNPNSASGGRLHLSDRHAKPLTMPHRARGRSDGSQPPGGPGRSFAAAMGTPRRRSPGQSRRIELAADIRLRRRTASRCVMERVGENARRAAFNDRRLGRQMTASTASRLADLYARACSGCRWRSSACCRSERVERPV